MQHGRKNSQHRTPSISNRIVLLFALLIFVLQLTGLVFHKHDISEQPSNCVSCVLAAHMSSDVPPVASHVSPALLVLRYQITTLPVYFFLAQHSYLVPPSHAPPQLFFPA